VILYSACSFDHCGNGEQKWAAPGWSNSERGLLFSAARHGCPNARTIVFRPKRYVGSGRGRTRVPYYCVLLPVALIGIGLVATAFWVGALTVAVFGGAWSILLSI